MKNKMCGRLGRHLGGTFSRCLSHLLQHSFLTALALVTLLLSATLATTASAHEMSMAEMDLRETSRGEFFWMWKSSDERQSGSRSLNPIWPSGCAAQNNLLRCGPAGLQGTLAVEGVGQRYSAAMLKVTWLDGQSRVYTLTASQPTVVLYGAADDPRGVLEIASAYGVLGVEHILGGIDHLLFVMGLLFLVGFKRQLVWTISAFTLAHSLTLASAALGWLTLRSAPVEACIALSIVLVAVEALHKRDTLTRRWPALVAFGFGLVHGLGFAGALQEIGLPEQHLAVALLSFNLGVEAGQLMAVLVAWALVQAVKQQAWAPRLQVPALYAMGSLAAYWSVLRVATVLA